MSPDRLETLLEFLRFPSVSTQKEHAPDMQACAEWLRELFHKLGFSAEVRPTAGHPVVIARTPQNPNKRTLLVYGHYDVQPPEPLELWETPPFEPRVQDGKIWARGSTDNKGQILAHILGLGELLAKEGELPLNVIFLVEGEEEIGSPNLEAFLVEHRDELTCDVIAISDSGMVKDFYPTLAYSMRGIAAMELHVKGPSADLHSGVYGGAVMNPLTAAARLIACLHDSEGRVTIPGFYDKVLPPLPWEAEAEKICPVTEDEILLQTGSPSLFGEPGFSTTQRIGARPTAEVNGMGGGYQGEGTKTVLPSEGFVKLTFRLVPNQDPNEILALAEAHLTQCCPPGVHLTITKGHSGEPYFCDPMSPDGMAAQRALEATFGAKPALTREGGSIPILTALKKVLGADSLLLALASPDCCVHSPNENYPIRNFEAGITLTQALMSELAKISRSAHGAPADLPAESIARAGHIC